MVIVGGGSGTQVGDVAAERGMDVAVVDPGPLGGTCVTRGCVPSKALVHRADLVEQLRRAGSFGIDVDVGRVDVRRMIEETTETVFEMADGMERTVRDSPNHTRFDAEGTFVGDRTLLAGDERIRGETVVIATGARPTIPPIDGLDTVDYLTSTEALRLDERPDHLLVIGGGYVGVELAHVYGSMGSAITLFGRSEWLLPNEDREVSQHVTAAFEDRYDVHVGFAATDVTEDDDGITVRAESEGGEELEATGDALLVATGREPNTESLNLEAAGIETDDDGFVETNASLETSADGVWALGDVVGPPLFKHVADYEARIVTSNALDGERRAVNYEAIAHAVFTSPQVASVGRTTSELDEEGIAYEIGRAAYDEAPLGLVSKADGFVKVLADPDAGSILGCHVVGPHASVLIHEVVVAMTAGSGTVNDVVEAVHVHPALNEVVLAAFDKLATVPYTSPPDWSSVDH